MSRSMRRVNYEYSRPGKGLALTKSAWGPERKSQPNPALRPQKQQVRPGPVVARCRSDVRFGQRSFDHLVGNQLEIPADGQTERLDCGFGQCDFAIRHS